MFLNIIFKFVHLLYALQLLIHLGQFFFEDHHEPIVTILTAFLFSTIILNLLVFLIFNISIHTQTFTFPNIQQVKFFLLFFFVFQDQEFIMFAFTFFGVLFAESFHFIPFFVSTPVRQIIVVL
jgi:hypothetical protein